MSQMSSHGGLRIDGTHSRPTKRMRRTTNTYERKRVIRRIDRAVQSLLEVLIQQDEDEQDEDRNLQSLNNMTTAHETNTILGDDTVVVLMNILTELPKTLLGSSMEDIEQAMTESTSGAQTGVHQDTERAMSSFALTQDSNSNTNDYMSVTNTSGNTSASVSENPSATSISSTTMSSSCTLVELLEDITCTTCDILQDYRTISMPLELSHTDLLLDRVVSLILSSSSASTSTSTSSPMPLLRLLSLLNQNLLLQEQSETPCTSSEAETSSNMLFVLDVNETITLTQLLLPVSLRHLSYSWIFDIKEHDDGEDGGVDIEKRHEGNSTGGNHEDAGIGQNQQRLMEQEGEVLLRVLVGYLFRHLSSLFSKSIQEKKDQDNTCTGGKKQSVGFVFISYS